MSDPVLTLLGFLVVFAVLGIAEIAKRSGRVGEEGTRKLVHIGVGHWMFVAIGIQDARWAAAAPASFIVLNYLSYRKGLFSAMERYDKAGGLGTVYYSVSLTVIVLWFWRAGQPRWAGTAGILIMAWGDGLAAIVGDRWGSRVYALVGTRKSLEGSAAMFMASAIVLVVCAHAAGVPPSFVRNHCRGRHRNDPGGGQPIRDGQFVRPTRVRPARPVGAVILTVPNSEW